MTSRFKSLLFFIAFGCGTGANDKNDVLSDQGVAEQMDGQTEGSECALDFVSFDVDGDTVDIFTFEASLGADGQLCSQRGLLPLHSITQGEAARSCESMQWRLCTLDEMTRACKGSDNRLYPYGPRFVAGRCNVRDAYVPEGETRGAEAPSGYFSECVSEVGAFDLTGNLWEWVAREGDSSTYFGAGYQIIAERHRDIDHSCDSYLTLPGIVGEMYEKNTVGFRCCRDSVD